MDPTTATRELSFERATGSWISFKEEPKEDSITELRNKDSKKTVIEGDNVHGSCDLCGAKGSFVEKSLKKDLLDFLKEVSKSFNVGSCCPFCSDVLDNLKCLLERKAELETLLKNLTSEIKDVQNLNQCKQSVYEEKGDVEEDKDTPTTGDVELLDEIKPESVGLKNRENQTRKQTSANSKLLAGNSVFDFKNFDKTYLECDSCSRHFSKSNPRAFQAHVHKAGGRVAFRCPERNCSKEYSSYVGLHGHWYKSNCGKRQKVSPKLSRRKNIKCYFCQKSEYNFTSMRLHIRQHTKEYVPYKCEIEECGGIWFRSLYMIKRHNTLVHGAKEDIEKFREKEGDKVKRYFNKSLSRRKCYFCGKIVTQYSALFRHMRSIHTLEKDLNLRCTVCCKVLSDARSLKIHLASVHCTDVQLKKEIVRKRVDYNRNKCLPHLKCYFCGKQHKRLCHLFTDMRRHLNEQELHKCVKCKAVYYSETGLKYHLSLRCGTNNAADKERFQKKNQLRYQRNKERLSKQSGCEKCHKRFRLGYMKKHIKICYGDDEVRKTCKICDEKFATVIEATVHFRSFHDSRKSVFVCYFCGKNYPNFSTFELHFVRHLKENVRKY